MRKWWKRYWYKAVTRRWVAEAMQEWTRHKCIGPVHYWLSQMKPHYKEFKRCGK